MSCLKLPDTYPNYAIGLTYVHCCALSSAFLAIGTRIGGLRIRNLQTGDERTLCAHANRVHECVFSRNEQYLATTSYDRSIKVWDPTTGTCLHTIQGHEDVEVRCSLSSDGSFIATVSPYETELHIWNVQSGACVKTLHDTSDILTCSISLDDSLIASASMDDITAKIWDVQTGTLLRTLKGHTSQLNSCVYSFRDAPLLATTSRDETIKLWNAHMGVCLRTINIGFDYGECCGFSADGLYVATSSWDMIKIWNMQSGACDHITYIPGSLTMKCAYSPDGSQMVTLFDGYVCVWTVPHQLHSRVKTLLMVLIGNRYHRFRLPAELWYWMETLG